MIMEWVSVLYRQELNLNKKKNIKVIVNLSIL